MCNCILCRNKVADKTGSHIIPNFLIESSFADGKYKGRGRELVYSVNIVSDFSFGRDILPDKVEKAIGRTLTDEDIEKNSTTPILYVRDYVFCSECEKRFSTIESLYASSISKCYDAKGAYTNSLAPHLSHLFWLSVIWRISAVDFEFRFIDESGIE